MSTHRRLQQTLSVRQAAENSPSLTRLTQLVKESNDRFKVIESLLPDGLRPAVKAGPIDEKNWCLLVDGNAAAAKTRQLIPLFQARLSREGWRDAPIRLKILLAKK